MDDFAAIWTALVVALMSEVPVVAVPSSLAPAVETPASVWRNMVAAEFWSSSETASVATLSTQVKE